MEATCLAFGLSDFHLNTLMLDIAHIKTMVYTKWLECSDRTHRGLSTYHVISAVQTHFIASLSALPRQFTTQSPGGPLSHGHRSTHPWLKNGIDRSLSVCAEENLS